MSTLSQLAVPFVYGLIFFLGYPSQWMLMHLEPEPLTKNELIASNVILVLIWITYTKSVFVDPGTVPKDWAEKELRDEKEGDAVAKSRKWCRKCDAAKPPRAHHCKECKRCIPKMDHHCPWTANCVSHTTFPHFLRFLFYTTIGLSILEAFLFTRLAHLWSNRDLPSYLGPSFLQLAHLFTTLIANSITLFVLGILFLRNIWCLSVNTTTIEGWEIERHKTLLRRARHFGGYLSTPDGSQIRIKRQEFPYDIGIFANIAQGMGSSNPLNWLNPFAATPSLASGLSFETNDFEDASTTWPPPDPDRSYRRRVKEEGPAFTYRDAELSKEDTLAAFRARQAEDEMRRRKPFVERMEAVRDTGGDDYEYDHMDDASEEAEDEGRKYGEGDEGEEGWRNSEGERLKDFGVDEDAEFYDEQEDHIPLSELMARRQVAAASASEGWSMSGSTY
ncbi:zf-DHHC-domain-containing protein [Macroventuria anomochaeta]|uniref:Zf-DHHC-domain-containing protein n=1 Tax=Macroventuria anomochaeta TaxID=301207 RepID=A0ACB6RL71_9PLEO|nr:zf-DHHC-domain-containing protein [Macroventuria anomochaeta]KAF2622761.1 zf-DHHC-domain-containing protein [Macroventuria anomochaeta]